MCSMALEQREVLQLSLSPPEPRLSEEPQESSREISGVTKKETVPCSSAQSCDGLHTGMREITVSPSPISSDVGAVALTDRSARMFFCLL